MKKLVFCVLLMFMSCSESPPTIEGVWNVRSEYYNAQYKITVDDGEYTGTVISYDDGTRKYSYDVHNKSYVFKQVTLNNGYFTNELNTSDPIYISQVNRNTLQVSSYILGKRLTEQWLRKE